MSTLGATTVMTIITTITTEAAGTVGAGGPNMQAEGHATDTDR